MCAEAFLRGHFFAGMHTNQRCEAMNRYVKCFIDSQLKIYEFVKQIDRGLSWLRYNEIKNDYDIKYTIPIVSPILQSLEKHAATFYTKTNFFLVRQEIQKLGALITSSSVTVMDSVVYTMHTF